jgi:TrmH family RNA methyltransferase
VNVGDQNPSPGILQQLRIVLLEPRDPVNIAAVVRSMKNMGVSELRLVRPIAYDPWRIEGIAHDTRDVVDRIRHFDDLDTALADCVRVAAFAGKRRAARWTVMNPERAADDLASWSVHGPVAMLFGREDWGLPGDALDRAQVIVNIPTTEHSSLNLAQAVLIGLYEMHLRAGDATRMLAPPRKSASPPTGEQFERLFADAHRALQTVDFFKTRNAELILRTVRSLAFRAAPDARELELVRAMLIEVGRAFERARKHSG